MVKQTRTFVFLILGFLIVGNVLAWIAVFELSSPQFLEVSFFDVGQGDAILIITPQRHQILIDGGPDSTVLEKLGTELPFWDRSLDLIILTHPEHDHISGLIEVLKRYKVDWVFWTGVLRETAEYKEWSSLLEKGGPEVVIAQNGRKVTGGGVLFDVLYPFENLEGKRVKNTNNSSIVGRLVFDDISFLFTGDAYKSVERQLIARSEINLSSDVLKVGHHGSKASSKKEFLEAVKPRVGVISVAGKSEVGGESCDNKERNRYGHPNCEVLASLEKYGIKTLRTDIHGDIEIISDGSRFEVK